MENHKIPGNKIIVLSNRSFENSIFSEETKLGDITLVKGGAGARKNSVRFRNIQQFKGLESDVVILVVHKREQDKEERYQSDELLYVGYTRARHLLYVVEVG